jgi:hypothetical protein
LLDQPGVRDLLPPGRAVAAGGSCLRGGLLDAAQVPLLIGLQPGDDAGVAEADQDGLWSEP